MSVTIQSTLFDDFWGADVADGESSVVAGDTVAGAVAVPPLPRELRRVELGQGAWVELLPGWIRDADAAFERLLDGVPWIAEEVPMYERVVAVPRLLRYYGEGAALPDEVLVQAKDRINDHYRPRLGEDLVTTGMCLYRDGRDSVAWHGDKIGRSATEDTHIAIVSFGSARELAFRPRGGKLTHRFALGHGDLVVMGGSCQRTWEHAVLKTSRPVGARISVQFRAHNVK